MSGSRRGVISESLVAARNVRPWSRTGELGMPESTVWRALRGGPAETVVPEPGRHRRPDDEVDPGS